MQVFCENYSLILRMCDVQGRYPVKSFNRCVCVCDFNLQYNTVGYIIFSNLFSLVTR